MLEKPMNLKKPFNFFIAIFIALGLFLSPFSMKHGYSASISMESTSTHCLESDSKVTKKITSHHEKSSDSKNKNTTNCCVAACVAIIFPQTQINFNVPFVKSALVISDISPLFGSNVEGLARPPKFLS